jgi:uncharacterized membrane protein
MTDVQTISIVVAAVGVFIAAINSIYSSRRAEEQRQDTLETETSLGNPASGTINATI